MTASGANGSLYILWGWCGEEGAGENLGLCLLRSPGVLQIAEPILYRVSAVPEE